ncbi:MAG: zinc-dependent peptidase [Cyclobacteriaceae bacterium]|nr:zinc-dependent peptidase [Cyclobacteriaceae bacterium]
MQSFWQWVSEYFFSNPQSFQGKHPKLFKLLSSVYNTDKYNTTVE